MHNKQSGFGLIEVMISVAIMSIVLAGMAQLSYYTALQSTTTDIKSQAAALASSVSNIALNDISCTAAVTKTPQTYGQHIKFDMPDGNVVYTNVDFEVYKVYTRMLEFDGKLVATGGDGSKAYYGVLQLSLSTKRQVIGPQDFAPKALGSIFITVSSTGVITHCGGVAPILPAALVPPPVTEEDVKAACNEIGGIMSGKACVFPPKGDNKDEGCNH